MLAPDLFFYSHVNCCLLSCIKYSKLLSSNTLFVVGSFYLPWHLVLRLFGQQDIDDYNLIYFLVLSLFNRLAWPWLCSSSWYKLNISANHIRAVFEFLLCGCYIRCIEGRLLFIQLNACLQCFLRTFKYLLRSAYDFTLY